MNIPKQVLIFGVSDDLVEIEEEFAANSNYRKWLFFSYGMITKIRFSVGALLICPRRTTWKDFGTTLAVRVMTFRG